jgi:hypothetical protein
MRLSIERELDRLRQLPVPARAAIVLGGYAIAVAVAFGIVMLNSILAGPQGDASDGMKAFGDAILFLLVFAIASVPPTAAAIVFAVLHFGGRRKPGEFL